MTSLQRRTESSTPRWLIGLAVVLSLAAALVWAAAWARSHQRDSQARLIRGLPKARAPRPSELIEPPREMEPLPGFAQRPVLKLERPDGTPLLVIEPFDRHGVPIPSAFEQISKVLSARGGERVPISPRLVEVLIIISHAFDDMPIGVVSGHRRPGRGTRRTSHHVAGRAIDIVLRGVPVHDLRDAAVRLGAGGVGVYPKFVHVDVRDDAPYRWVGGRWPRGWRRPRHWRSRRTARKP